MKRTSHNTSGFSLIELSIVIAIAAVMIGSGLMMINEYSNRSKIEQTREKMEEIMKMVKRYYIRFHRLPCPADPNLSFSDPSIGMETNCNTATITHTNAGALPTDAFGLHPNYMIDAWGNRFKYAVEFQTSLNCNPNNGTPSPSAPTDTIKLISLAYGGGVGINGMYATAIGIPTIAVALISHGENGLGAHTGRSGSTNPASAEPHEVLNATDPYDLYASVAVNSYDDITYMYSYGQLIATSPAIGGACTNFADPLMQLYDEGIMYGR